MSRSVELKPRSTQRRLARLALCSMAVSLAATTGAWTEQAVTEPNYGNDITRPIHRVDFFFNNTQSSGGVSSWTSSVRYERPFTLPDSWKFAFRVELPVVVTNDPGSSSDPPTSFVAGIGNTVFQVGLSKDVDARQAFGLGLRFLAPPPEGDRFGNGRWRMLPTAGYRYYLPEISNGSFLQFVARYAFDFAGNTTSSHTSELQMSPSLNVGLPDNWYVTLFPSTDLRYNFIRREWFVPFDFEMGKQWSDSLVTGLEVAAPLFDTPHPVYKFKIEGHIGFRF